MADRLLGITATSESNTAADYMHAARWQAAESGTVTELRVYCGTSGNVKIAVYDDNSGVPGNRLAYDDSGQSVTAGAWRTLTISEFDVTQGEYYHIVHVIDTAGAVRRNNQAATGDRRYAASTYSTHTWPASLSGTSWSTADTAICSDAWGDIAGLSITDVDSDYGASSEEFDVDEDDLDIDGSGFEASQGTGTVYLADESTLAASDAEVDLDDAIQTWSDTTINLDLTALGSTELAAIESLISSDGHSLYIIVENDSAEENYIAVTVHRAKAFGLAASSYIAASGENTTARLTAPSGKTTGDFDAGRIQDDENPCDAIDITDDDYTEIEWCIEALAGSIDGETYQFRLLFDGAVIDTYTVTPEVTISAGVTINHTKLSIELSPKTHSLLIDEAISQTKQTIEADSKTHNIAIDEMIFQALTPPMRCSGTLCSNFTNWVFSGMSLNNTDNGRLYITLNDILSAQYVYIYKDASKTQLVCSGNVVGEFPPPTSITLNEQNNSGLSGSVDWNHTLSIGSIELFHKKSINIEAKSYSIAIDELITQSKQATELASKSHSVLIDEAIAQTKQAIDITGKSHSVAIDLLIPQTKQDIDISPKTHSALIDEAISQTKQSIELTPKTHTIAIDEVVNQIKQSIEATAQTHAVLLDIAISQTKQTIEADSKTHTIQVTENIEINQAKQSIDVTPQSHSIAIDELITHSKQAVEITPKTHTVLIDVAYLQTKQSVDVTAKAHSIAIDLIINQIKQAIEADTKTHSILIDEAVSQVKQSIEANPKTHTIQISEDIEINQSKQTVDITAKTHSILLDEAISQIKQTLEATTKIHTIAIDEIAQQTKQSIDVDSKTHSVSIGTTVSQTKESIDVTSKTHLLAIDEMISQSKQSIDVSPKSHSVAIDELINQIKQSINIAPKSHAITIDEVINQIAQSIDVTGKTHTVIIDEIINQVKAALNVMPNIHNVVIDEVFNQTRQSIEFDPKVHTIITTPDIEIQQVLKHIILTEKSHTVLIVGGFIIIIGKGLMTMDRKVIFDFEYPQQILPVVELNENATAHGDIELKIDDLEEITSITSVIYSCNPPSSSSDNWQGVGNDIYSSSILNITSAKMSSGRNKLHYIFDPSGIVGIGDGQFYAVIIKVNSADDATIPQAGVEMIFKINNNIAVP